MKTFIINCLNAFGVFFFMFTSLALSAQQKVSGKIIDAVDSTPIVLLFLLPIQPLEPLPML